MQPDSSSTTSASPLLFRHATPRTSSANLSGHYDSNAQLWVVETKTGLIPVVESGDSPLLDTRTLTEVRQEADDDDLSSDAMLGVALLDTSTLTKVRQEGADDDLSSDDALVAARYAGSLAEIATKTAERQESDDQIVPSGLLELETRSLNNQEGIDEDWPRMML